MKIHALALGAGDEVEKLDEMQCPMEHRVRCTGRWLPADRRVYRALPPAEFLQDLERIEEEGNEPCGQCLELVRQDHALALEVGYAALNAAEDHARRKKMDGQKPGSRRETGRETGRGKIR